MIWGKKMKRVKVIEFIGAIQDGGAETLIKDYALKIDKASFEITVVSIYDHKNTGNSRILHDNNVQVISVFPKRNIFSKIILHTLDEKYVSLKLLKIIKDVKPDVIHSHLSVLHYLYPIAKDLDNVKMLYTCHNLPQLFFDGKRKKDGIAAETFIKNHRMQMIALHDNMATEINKRFHINNTAVIRNGIDFNRFTNIQESKENIRQKLNIPQDAYVIGHVGRFSDQKNHSYLIDCFNEAAKKNDKAFLLLVGSGPLKEEIINKVNSFGLSNKVLFLEHRMDIPQIMKAMDVFFFPSKFEGLGIVLIEAQVVGLPCVVSNQIPHEAFKSKNITELSLDVAPDIWADNLLNPVGNISEWGDISEYDMNKEIKKLEKLYSGEYDGK